MCDLNSWFLCKRLSLNLDKQISVYLVLVRLILIVNLLLMVQLSNKLIHASIWEL